MPVAAHTARDRHRPFSGVARGDDPLMAARTYVSVLCPRRVAIAKVALEKISHRRCPAHLAAVGGALDPHLREWRAFEWKGI